MRQDTTWNWISKKLFLGLGVALFIFCSWETVQLVQKVLDPNQWVLAFAAIGAFDLGIISWALVHRHDAANSQQRGISAFMIGVDLIASGFGWVASLFMQASSRGEISKINQGDLFGFIVGGMGAVIFLNAASALFYHLYEPKAVTNPVLPTMNRPTSSKVPHFPVYHNIQVQNPVKPAQEENPVLDDSRIPTSNQLPVFDPAKVRDLFTFTASNKRQVRVKKLRK